MSRICCTAVALWTVMALWVMAGAGLAETRQSAVYKVIVNEENPTDALTQAEISAMLLKKRIFWSHGAAAVAVDLL